MTVDLVVIRHATAEPFGETDRARELTPTGHGQARACGAWLSTRIDAFEHVVVSSAVRTTQTWKAIATAAGWDVDQAEYEESLYHAEPEEIVDLLQQRVGDGPALVIGHNPTVSTLSHLLQDGQGSQSAMQELARGFSPATAAVFTSHGSWADLSLGGAKLQAVYRT